MTRKTLFEKNGSPRMTSDARAALSKAGFSRRDLLRGAGALFVGFSMSGGADNAVAQSAPFPDIPLNQVDSWVVIAADNTVTGYAGKCDFGQGFRTVQHQLIAEELDVPLENVKMLICDTAFCPNQGVSSGSQGTPTQFGSAALRQALATARDALLQMASQRLNAPTEQLDVADGVIFLRSNPERNVSYGQLIGGKKFSVTLNARAAVKNPAGYKILGTSVPRYDVPTKVTGEFEYVQNVRVPGMLHGKVVRPPAIGAKVVRVDQSSVASMPGNVKVVVKNDFVGVVADREWQALQAAEALKVEWSAGATLPDQADLYDYMRKQPTRDAITVRAADVDQKLAQAARVVRSTYLHPYQMHGSLGTSSSVADVRGTGANATATVWSSTQGVYPLRDSIAAVTGIPVRNIRVIFVEGSGCYGINGADTVSYDAALMSQAVGKPVRVQYTRKDEMVAGENYGPAYVIDLKAALDDRGAITAWDYESWTLAKGGRPNGNAAGNVISGALAGIATAAVVPSAGNNPNAFGNNGNAASSYGAGCVGSTCGGTGTIRSERVITHTVQSPFFTGPLRSPARLQNSFANESFMDEIAAVLKADPVQLRLQYLSDHRLADCVTGAADAYGWDSRPSPKPGNARTGVVTGRGIACVLYEGDNGYCALVAEVEVNQDTGEIAVKRLVASQDSGPVLNPDGMRNQMEGGALQGMSRALKEEVRWNEETVTSLDWRRYPVYAFGEPLPTVETVLINRPEEEPMGSGECTITIAAAAIANAVFDATGARLREVPFTRPRVLAALRARS